MTIGFSELAPVSNLAQHLQYVCARRKQKEMKISVFQKAIIAVVGLALTFPAAANAQNQHSEISAQVTGFFAKDSGGNGVHQEATNSAGLLVGYRYNFNYWLAAEANYGYSRNTQIYSGLAPARIQANVHEITGAAVVKLPLGRLQPFALAGAGALVFDPTNNPGGSFAAAGQETKAAFLYGVGADYRLTHHFALRGEYRGLVYKAPSFGIASLDTDGFTHMAQPSAGIVFRF